MTDIMTFDNYKTDIMTCDNYKTNITRENYKTDIMACDNYTELQPHQVYVPDVKNWTRFWSLPLTCVVYTDLDTMRQNVAVRQVRHGTCHVRQHTHGIQDYDKYPVTKMRHLGLLSR